MPSNSPEYIRKNYKKYRGKPKQISERSERNKARRKMEKAGKVKKHDGKEVDHKRGVKAGNGKSNLRVISRKTNRRLGALKSARVKKRK